MIASGQWPPPYEGMVAAPAGEPATSRWVPSKDGLEYTHKALQVTFLLLALIGLMIVVSSTGLRSVLTGAARKQAIA